MSVCVCVCDEKKLVWLLIMDTPPPPLCHAGLQPFVPLLNLANASNGNLEDKDLLHVIFFSILCLEKFSSVKRYRKKMWHDFALNGGINPLKHLLKSNILSGDWEYVRQAILNIFNNLGVDTSDIGVTVDQSTYFDDMRSIFDRKDMFCDCVLVFPQQQQQQQIGTGSCAAREKKELYCHKAILAARCKFFAVMLSRWDNRHGAPASTSPSPSHAAPPEEANDKTAAAAGSCGLSKIEITEFDYDTMRRVVDYIYTDKPELGKYTHPLFPLSVDTDWLTRFIHKC